MSGKRKSVRSLKPGNITWREAMAQFLTLKRAQGLAERTIQDYEYHISLLFKKFPDAWPDRVKEAVLNHMAEPVKPATFNIRRKYLKAFFDWCIEEGYMAENPLANIRKKKDNGRTINLDVEIVRKLITLPNTKTFSGLRDKALMYLTLDTGIRPKEAFSLLPGDVNLRTLEVYIRSEEAKTRVARTLPISPQTAKLIKQLIDARHPQWEASVPLFCTFDGRPMNYHRWNCRLQQYCKQLGGDVKVTGYMLRHFFALEFLRNGGQALALQRLLGHTTLDMTKRYVALTQNDLHDQHTAASPLAKLTVEQKRVRKARR